MVVCDEVDGLMFGGFVVGRFCGVQKVSRSELIQIIVWTTYQIVSLTEWPVRRSQQTREREHGQGLQESGGDRKDWII